MDRYAHLSLVLILVFTLGMVTSACSDSSSPCAVSIPDPPVSATPEEIEYSEWHKEITEKIYAAQDRFDEALGEFSKGSTDTYQLIIVARELVNFSTYYEESIEKKAPPSLDCVHKGLLRSLQEYKAASDAVTSGSVDKLPDHIDSAKRLLFQAGSLYDQWEKGHK